MTLDEQAIDVVERAWVGSVLLGVPADAVPATDLASASHRAVVRAALAVAEHGLAVDALLISAELGRRDLLNAIGGTAYLAELVECGTGDALAAAAYANKVRDAALGRRVTTFAQDVQAVERERGPREALRYLQEGAAALTAGGSRGPTRYEADSLDALLVEPQLLVWRIERWLEDGVLGLIVGAEGSLKSFVAIDWALSIATGRDWHGYRVTPGRVLYVAGEGRAGVIRRMRGWLARHQVEAPEHVLLGRGPIQLLDTLDATRVSELGKFALIVIDTLARNFGAGSENDQADMSVAIANADRIRSATGAAVLLVHHTPLEGRDDGKLRPRGSTALPGAADAMFSCAFDRDSKVLTLASFKQKDAASPDPLFLGYDVVDLGDLDNFGNAVTTLVLRGTEARPVPKKTLAKNQRALIKSIRHRANGSSTLLVMLRDETTGLALSRQSRLRLEDWFREQPWARAEIGGGYVVDLEGMPDDV